METGKIKIPFYVKRPFGEKMNASFDFIKQNWKVMLKYITYMILPICLLQSLTLNNFMRLMYSPEFMQEIGKGETAQLFSFFFEMLALMGFYILGTSIVTGLTYTFMKLYNERQEGIGGITYHDFKSLFWSNVGRYFLLCLAAILVMTGISVVITITAVLSLYTLWITIPLFFAISIAMTLWIPIYLFEKIGVFQAFAKSMRLGFATWGGVFLISLVMGLIAGILRGVLSTPLSVNYVIQSIFSYSDTASTPSVAGSFMMYLFGVLSLFGSYISIVFTLIGLAYQYAHASEEVSGISVESDIDNFENL